MTLGEISLELGGARSRLRCSCAELMQYAALHLAPLRIGEGFQPDVEAKLEWHDGPPPTDRLGQMPSLSTMERLDRDLYREDGRLAWFRIDDMPGLHLRFRWDGAKLQVEGDYYFHLSGGAARDRVKRFLYHRRADDLRRRRFTTLLYYLIYYPCFWWLERTRGVHPIHAAGVETGGGVTVLAGPSGVGKSTLSVALSAAPDARFLSDTFLLHQGTAFFPVREPLLLDDQARNWLGESAALLEPIDWRYCLGRRGYHWPRDRASDGGDAFVLLFPRRATAPYVRPLPPLEAHAQLSAGGLLVNDLRRYWAYAAALDALDPHRLVSAREASLAGLTSRVPSFELGLTMDMNRGELIAWIKTAIGRGSADSAVATAGGVAVGHR